MLSTTLVQLQNVQAQQANRTTYQALSANIVNGNGGTIEIVYTERIEFSLNKSLVPSNWETQWQITNPNIFSCQEFSDQNYDQLRCTATNQYGLSGISAYNANNTNEWSNNIAVIVRAPQNNDFISCINPPSNHLPSTCIDQFQNGQWIRNAQFSCNTGYSKSGSQCVLGQTTPSFPQRCFLKGYWGFDDDFIVQLEDRDTNAPSSRCKANDWVVAAQDGGTDEIGPKSQNQDLVKFKRLRGGKINVQAVAENTFVAESFDVAAGSTYSNTSTSTSNTISRGADLKFTGVKSDYLEWSQNYEFMTRFQNQTVKAERVLLFKLAVKNYGSATFSESQSVNGKNYWPGSITCEDGTNVSGVVHYPTIAAQESTTVLAILDISSILNSNLTKFTCNLQNNIGNYTQVNPDFTLQSITFDVNLRGDDITLSNFNEDFSFRTNKFRYFTAPSSALRFQTSKNTSTGSSSTPSSSFTPQANGRVEYEDEVRVKFNVDENPFKDTTVTSIAGTAAAELHRRNIIGGFPDGEFKGSRPVNRAEAAKFLLLARGYDTLPEVSNSRFRDVLANEWYTKYTERAAELGIINGHPDGTFRPADQVLTAEFLKMLSITFGLQTNLPYTYDDESKYRGAWFWQYAGIAQKYELFPHRTTSLRPETPLTRNEVAVAIYQFLKNRNN